MSNTIYLIDEDNVSNKWFNTNRNYWNSFINNSILIKTKTLFYFSERQFSEFEEFISGYYSKCFYTFVSNTSECLYGRKDFLLSNFIFDIKNYFKDDYKFDFVFYNQDIFSKSYTTCAKYLCKNIIILDK